MLCGILYSNTMDKHSRGVPSGGGRGGERHYVFTACKSMDLPRTPVPAYKYDGTFSRRSGIKILPSQGHGIGLLFIEASEDVDMIAWSIVGARYLRN